MHDEGCNTHSVFTLHGFRQQPIRLARLVGRCEKVRAFKIDWRNLFTGDEQTEVNDARFLWGEPLQFLLAHSDVLSFAGFETTYRRGFIELVSSLRADIFALQWVALRPKHAQRYSAITVAGIEVDRNADKAKANRARPEGSHTRFPLTGIS